MTIIYSPIKNYNVENVIIDKFYDLFVQLMINLSNLVYIRKASNLAHETIDEIDVHNSVFRMAKVALY